jgi:OFA family oxalate/formate antiporter-like MFS transporter
MRWYPDKKGLITGLAVAGFGFGATLWMTLAGKLGALGGGELIKTIGMSDTFIVLGGIFFITILTGSIWMKFPAPGWKPAGWNPSETKTSAKMTGHVDFTSGQMLKTFQFYMIVLTYAFGAGAGLMSIGLMKLWPMEALQANGISKEVASAAATLAMAIFFALFNGLGRIVWGMISDKIGRKLSIAIMMATQGIFVILFQWMAGIQATLYIFAVLIGSTTAGCFHCSQPSPPIFSEIKTSGKITAGFFLPMPWEELSSPYWAANLAISAISRSPLPFAESSALWQFLPFISLNP